MTEKGVKELQRELEAAKKIVEKMNMHLIREIDEAEKRYNKEFGNYSVDRLQDLEEKK